MEPILTKLSPEAEAFIRLLQSLDYLSPQISKILFTKLLHMHEENSLITLNDLKRCIAIILFEQKEILPARTKLFLKKDWNMLFG
jgi:uncharacterized protein Smg (DUF494 family)